MRIVITGATGFIGGKLCARLGRDGHELTVLSRDPAAARLRLGLTARYAAWDTGPSVQPELLAGHDAVVHLAGHPVAAERLTEAVKVLIRESRTASTRAIVGALSALKGEGPRTLVCASAVGYYGDRGEETLVESSPPGSDFLAGVCRGWEAEAARAESAGARVVSLRFGIVLGRGGALARMLPPFRLGLGGRLGSGRQWMSWIHVEDAVGTILHALDNARMRGAAIRPFGS